MSKATTIGRIAAATAIAASSLLVVGSTASQAASECPAYGNNTDGGSLYTNGSVAYHNGPASNCAIYSNRSGKAAIWCSKYNSSGNLWYLARDLSSGTLGWVWSGNVSSTSGSNHAKC